MKDIIGGSTNIGKDRVFTYSGGGDQQQEGLKDRGDFKNGSFLHSNQIFNKEK